MKRVTLLAVCLILAVSVSAQDDLTGKMFAGGYLGYGFGFGDAFEDIETGLGTIERGAGFGFGGTFHYGLNEKLMIGGELGFQNYKAGDESELETNILFNGLYAFNYVEDETGFFGTFGGGFYGGSDTNFGINGGILYSKLISETISLYGMPRLHIIFADGTPMILQLAVGVLIPIGGSY